MLDFSLHFLYNIDIKHQFYRKGKDYTQGACQEILDVVVRTNFENLTGYGADKYCESAKVKIRKACESENADVYFLVGGT